MRKPVLLLMLLAACTPGSQTLDAKGLYQAIAARPEALEAIQKRQSRSFSPPEIESLFTGKTILFQGTDMPLQVEYFDPAGRSYLWVPGNGKIVRGSWHIGEKMACFVYTREDFTPELPKGAPSGNCQPIDQLIATSKDHAEGDLFHLMQGVPEYRFMPGMHFQSLEEIRLKSGEVDL